MPTGIETLLDVGCSHGGFAASLRADRPGLRVWGIDMDDSLPASSTDRLDRFLCGRFPEDLPKGETWDCLTFVDSLEHFEDPWAALRHARSLLSPGGCIVAAVPNVRHYSVSLPLVFRGRFNYADRGILDKTHLRFFTRSSTEAMFESTGYRIDHIAASSYRKPPAHRVLALGGPLTAGLRAIHHLVRATPVDA